MKCPVCDKVNTSMLCPQCGFDSSRDYGKYPTFGPLHVMSASAMRREWQNRQKSNQPLMRAETPKTEMPVSSAAVKPEPSAPRKTTRKKIPMLLVLASFFVLFMVIGGMIGNSSVWRPNVLKCDSPNSEFVYGTDLRRSQVKTVTFLDSLAGAPEDAVDVSVNGDGSVMMWAVHKVTQYYDLFFAGNGGINGRDACTYLFYSYENLETVDFGDNFHTDEATSMRSMFYHCRSLTELDLHSFDTSNVQSMSHMFNQCTALSNLDLSSFDTSNVQNMSCMFYQCTALTNLNLNGFDTSSVQNIVNMFYGCPAGDDWQHLIH